MEMVQLTEMKVVGFSTPFSIDFAVEDRLTTKYELPLPFRSLAVKATHESNTRRSYNKKVSKAEPDSIP
jgi:hypothetical protein